MIRERDLISCLITWYLRVWSDLAWADRRPRGVPPARWIQHLLGQDLSLHIPYSTLLVKSRMWNEQGSIQPCHLWREVGQAHWIKDFCSLKGDGGEYFGVGFVEISRIFATRYEIFFGTEPYARVLLFSINIRNMLDVTQYFHAPHLPNYVNISHALLLM